MTSNSSQPADLVSLLAGEIDAATLAARHGITEAEALRWREAFLAGMRASTGGQAHVRRPRTRLVMVGVAMLATAAFAQLVTFNADQPALASEVNGNFTQLKSWLEAKVGVVSDPGNITTNGKVIAKVYAPAYADYAVVSSGITNGGAIVNDNAAWKTLMILGNSTGTGGRAISMHDNVTIYGNLSVTNNTWGSTTQIAETTFFTASTLSPSLSWLDCATGQYVCGIGVGHMANDNNYWTGARLSMKCCAL
jgi:hypothetical protein